MLTINTNDAFIYKIIKIVTNVSELNFINNLIKIKTIILYLKTLKRVKKPLNSFLFLVLELTTKFSLKTNKFIQKNK